MPKYIVFAGPNGSGKSTLYQTNRDIFDIPRVNVDEIVRQNNGDWRNAADVVTAGKIAIQKIKTYFASLTSFNQETTLCGKSAIQNIKKAQSLGYTIELYFVYVESAEIAKQRVLLRVAAGGHGIPEADIERRYKESLEKLKEVLPLCNKVELYDNSKRFRRVALIKSGKTIAVSNDVPEWVRGLLK